MLPLGGLHWKHTVQRGIWVPTHLTAAGLRYILGTDRIENIMSFNFPSVSVLGNVITVPMSRNDGLCSVQPSRSQYYHNNTVTISLNSIIALIAVAESREFPVTIIQMNFFLRKATCLCTRDGSVWV
jgi:hypothetical protein